MKTLLPILAIAFSLVPMTAGAEFQAASCPSSCTMSVTAGSGITATRQGGTVVFRGQQVRYDYRAAESRRIAQEAQRRRQIQADRENRQLAAQEARIAALEAKSEREARRKERARRNPYGYGRKYYGNNRFFGRNGFIGNANFSSATIVLPRRRRGRRGKIKRYRKDR